MHSSPNNSRRRNRSSRHKQKAVILHSRSVQNSPRKRGNINNYFITSPHKSREPPKTSRRQRSRRRSKNSDRKVVAIYNSRNKRTKKNVTYIRKL
jgi:hypothetical protein